MSVEEAAAEVQRDIFDFYCCHKCGRLITKLEESEAFTPGHKRAGTMCVACGSKEYRPANMRWFHWGLPRVWRFAYYRMRGMA